MDWFSDVLAFPLEMSGSVLRDQWTASLIRCALSCAQLPQPKLVQCLVCQKRWPVELLWPSGTTGSEDQMLCCPPCHRELQRFPSPCSQPLALTVLVRGGCEAARVVSMEQVLMHAHDQSWDRTASPQEGSKVVEECILALGHSGQSVVRLRLTDETSLYQALRSAVPNCNIDYLPAAPHNGPHCVEVVSKRHGILLPNSADLECWFSAAGGCSVVQVFLVSRQRAVVELADSRSWEAALALNGSILPCSDFNPIVSVVPATPKSCHQASSCKSNAVSVMHQVGGQGIADNKQSGQLEFLHLRALKDLPKAARRLVLSFLPVQVLVPNDYSLAEALKQRPETVFLSSGSHHLPNGIRITSSVELVGDCDGAEIILGESMTISSAHGALLRNLTFRADASAVRPPAALLRVDASHLEAVCWASQKVSNKSSSAFETCWTRTPFAVCSANRCAVRIEKCHFVGGRHAIDARGSIGLHRSHWKRGRNGFDLAAWLLRCRADWSTTNVSEDVPVQLVMDADAACSGSWPEWASRRCTKVELHCCTIEGASQEALHVWRGASIEMANCWVHHCGSGITVAHSCHNAGKVFHLLEPSPSQIVLEDNVFEELSTHAWSAAVAVGCLVLHGDVDESAQRLVGYREAADPSDSGQNSNYCPIVVTLRRNHITRCSMGFQACQITLNAVENKLSDLHLGGFHFRDCSTKIANNLIESVKGAAISISAESKAHCSNALQKNILRLCTLGIRVSSKVPLKMDSFEEQLECNTDAICIQGSGCNVAIRRCIVQASLRCGIHIDRQAHVVLDGSKVVGNGRGVAVADGSVDVRRCHFEDNIGWAVRLEGPAGQYCEQATGIAQEPELSAARQCRTPRPSVITHNTFGSATRGNVGRKRVRVDVWHNNSAEVEDNEGVNGEGPVEPLRKRRREDIAIEEDASFLLASLSLSR